MVSTPYEWLTHHTLPKWRTTANWNYSTFMKSIAILVTGVLTASIGVLGLLIPVIPGVLFLLIAALCFATLSPGLRQKMQRNPRLKRLLLRLDAGHGLQLTTRCKLMFWAILEAANPRTRI